MVVLPPRNRIRNFEQDMEAPRLFRSEGMALQGLFADPMLYMMGQGQAKLPEIGHLGVISSGRLAGVGLVSGQSLEMRIGASLQSLFQYYQWHKNISKGINIEEGQLPQMSVIAMDIDKRKSSRLNDSTAELRQEDDESRPVEANALTREMYKALLLEVGTLHILLHEEGARDAVSEIRLRHSRKYESPMSSTPFAMKLFQQEPLSKDELFEVQQRVDRIYVNLQKALCTSIPDAVMHDVVEHPLSAQLVTSSLEDIHKLYFHMYSPEGKNLSFAERFLNPPNGPDSKHR